FSPNIRDRLDFSCAIFDADGELCAQAAHIPVHLGSMAYAMSDVVSDIDWRPGDQVVFNDPFLGGTHLPDVTLVAPVFSDGCLMGFVVNRAHHADIGAQRPGSMPISRSLEEEGQIIPPTHLVSAGRTNQALLDGLSGAAGNTRESAGDFSAQLAANRAGARALGSLIAGIGEDRYREGLAALNDYAERLARSALQRLPVGSYHFEDLLDDDGQGRRDIPIRVEILVADEGVRVDFTGSAPQVEGNVNCPLAVTAAAVFYVFRCLMPPQTPACAGAFRPIELTAPAGSLLNAHRPAAVAAGNVETSTRVVDVLLGALAQAEPELIPAASHGSMNNLAIGAAGPHAWSYYETLGGGMGAHVLDSGLDAVQTHMTNTLNTPVEILESYYPLRVGRYALRRGSGGDGWHRGGDGLIRELEFLAPAHFTLLTERRRHAPWGLAGGGPARPGRNLLNGEPLPGKCEGEVGVGDRLSIETPGGGGWGHGDGRSNDAGGGA
ncbi:MAG: hydantoinase B/oxoprolinase family protein, partial [Gammaproteobacteria bacterium]